MSPLCSLRVERDEPPVDLGADALVPDVGVDAIGEVERRRAAGQLFDLALRREDVDLVLEDVGLERVDKLLRAAGDVLLPVHELAQPGDLGVELLVLAHAFLVAPVRGDAVFGHLVHLVRADLDLERPTVDRQDRRVQRLVQALFGIGDVVVELAGQRPPDRVDDAERRVAVGNRLRPGRGRRAGRRSDRRRRRAAASCGRCCRCASAARTDRPGCRAARARARRTSMTRWMYFSRATRRLATLSAISWYFSGSRWRNDRSSSCHLSSQMPRRLASGA